MVTRAHPLEVAKQRHPNNGKHISTAATAAAWPREGAETTQKQSH
jgi:hypothetical protein